MKKTLILLAMAAALVACQKSQTVPQDTTPRAVSFSVANLGTYEFSLQDRKGSGLLKQIKDPCRLPGGKVIGPDVVICHTLINFLLPGGLT